MSAYEQWVCDFHADPPESGEDFVNEDTARDAGWLRLELKTVFTTSDGSNWPRTEVKHVCDGCQKDPECREWLRDGNFKGYYDDDRDRLSDLVGA